MSTVKINIILPIILVLFLSKSEVTIEQNAMIGKVVQVQPAALENVLPVYSQSIVLFTNKIKQQNTIMFQNSIYNLINSHKIPNLNQTLFALCDITKDLSGKLKRFDGHIGISYINELTHYNLPFPQSQSPIQTYFTTKFPQFLLSHLPSKLPQIKIKELKQNELYNNNYTLVVFINGQQLTNKLNQIYHKIFHWLQFFNTKFVSCQHQRNQTSIVLYFNGEISTKYPSSAVSELFNYTNQPIQQNINELINFINVETIDDVTLVNNQNLIRVFGSSLDSQFLLIYRQKNADESDVKTVREEFKKAAIANRNDGLKYERVLFAEATTQIFSNIFQQEFKLNQQKLFQIILTKPDYSKFQMLKYVYDQKHVDKDKLIQFIQNVRMKKINANYKSQDQPNNEGKTIRKIVGNTFEKQIYDQKDKSVMILFIDSKDKNRTTQVTKILQDFIDKYNEAFKDQINVGIFDLAKNQHRFLSISSAPQLVLFQKRNKKMPKTFQGSITPDNIKNWINYEAKHVTIPENFGQPPLSLGGGGTGHSEQL